MRNIFSCLKCLQGQILQLVHAGEVQIQQYDQILFLDAGKIQERGSHRELMSVENGRYREYVEMQTRGIR